MSDPLLQLRELSSEFVTDDGVLRAVDRVSLELAPGEVLGLVGESGCGKSATALSILGLLPKPAGRIASGSIRFAGQELVGMSEGKLRRIRGRRIAMIFQDPMTSLNPYLRVSEQLEEVARLHLGLPRKQARERSVALLERVGIADASRRIDAYPHQFSGGMRQRVMIAMALLCNPDLLIADEPTTALDVTIQAQILELLRELQRERNMAILLITHDLGVVAGLCDRVVVMYAGVVMEEARTLPLFERPAHPYTAALLRSIPRLDVASRGSLRTIEGLPPRPTVGPVTECRFAPRCAHVMAACTEAEPPLVIADERSRRCLLAPGELR